MSQDGRKPPRRRLSDEEHALWRAVARSISPLRRRPRREVVSAEDEPKLPIAKASAKPAKPVAKLAHVPRPAAPAKPAVPQLMPIERRLKQRIARGTEPIDARIDLHGRTQNEAHAALLRFLHGAQAKGARVVLVITGKGVRADAAGQERGVLRRQVPLWLALPEFRAYVLGVEPAHIGHGGEGALYVRLRKAR
jgi:DNA-nicking Smr family endonuclease